MEEILFKVIVGVIVFGFGLERFLDYLNASRRSNKLPSELSDIYDADEYKKQQDYEKATSRMALISGLFNFVLLLGVLFFNIFGMVDNFVRTMSDNTIVVALSFFGVIMFASDLLNTPFSVYSTFVIEERFGFNKTTPKIYVLDKLKGWLLGGLLGGGILALIIWFYTLTGSSFWIYAWIVMSVFSIFMVMFYSSLIVPIFNKQKPLEAGELRTEIENFSKKVGFQLDNIFEIDGSKRSTKANAYFSGLGAKKRIVLFDTLINELSIPELVAVLAHEVGHYKKKHTMGNIVISLLQTGLMLYVFSLIVGIPEVSLALGVDQPGFHIALITFGILYSPLSSFLGLGMNMLSRKNEYEADHYAAKNYDAQPLGNALKKLSVKNLSNLTPHPAYVFFYYSHPTLLQRLKALKLI